MITEISKYFLIKSHIFQGYTAKRLQLQPLCQPSISVRIMSSQSHSSFVKDLLSSPAPALCLGFAGAIPFCSLAALSVATPEYMDIIAQAQCAYGATIVSFLGAVHWGFALAKESGLKPDWVTLGYSVSPSLVACVALLLKPGYGLMTLNLGLLYALTTDLATTGFPVWYYALRKSLSTLAVTSVLITLGSLYLH